MYNRHYGAFLNICWIKNKSERESVTNTICRQMGLARTESRYINIAIQDTMRLLLFAP